MVTQQLHTLRKIKLASYGSKAAISTQTGIHNHSDYPQVAENCVHTNSVHKS